MSGFTIFFATEKAFAGHMFTVGYIFCRPGISHLAVYFIYESSVASETKMRNAINHIKFRGSCFYITQNNTFCFTMLKILGSVHRQPNIETLLMSKCKHLRVSQMFQSRVQLQSQNSLRSHTSHEIMQM